ncbi:hypothetical protein K3G39_19840 [Pontibacter sp. HSC-14F20]|uniref:hypothetical protein n=1 Tax=Pontibacter sp. HSC-14F20 TaxID=2864136 RepID=UPI001C72A780|nr:hypothetical protein [Pontibacter sp. HSC-14F20]MBX0335492.1 hypothetical protein [Pontibacter sp. HSC-14F20]
MAEAESRSFFKTEKTIADIREELLVSSFEIWAGVVLQSSANTVMPILYCDFDAGQDSLPVSVNSSLAKLLRLLYKSTGTRTDLNKAVSAVFYDTDYDTDPATLSQWQEQAVQLPYFQELQHTPIFLHQETAETELNQLLDGKAAIFAFVNPFSNSVSLKALTHLLENSELGLFMHFTLQDMQVALKRAKNDEAVQVLFGDRLSQIRDFQKKNRSTDKREEFLFNTFEGLLREKGCYTFRFRINWADKVQTSRYLVFASKGQQAYTQLKELMVRYSEVQEDGVPLFGANLQQQQTSLFHEHYTYSIANLVEDLSQRAADYNNRTVQHVYEKHSISTYYTLENYKSAFEKLMRLGIVKFINPKTGQPISKLTTMSLIRYNLRK